MEGNLAVQRLQKRMLRRSQDYVVLQSSRVHIAWVSRVCVSREGAADTRKGQREGMSWGLSFRCGNVFNGSHRKEAVSLPLFLFQGICLSLSLSHFLSRVLSLARARVRALSLPVRQGLVYELESSE